ncbi:hypothetical protein LPJ61_005585 [Coemansia biformis]|uniref:Uncharacterized protein n=1 Tax=Coemansia biformis TaxID=1286918 RepID=A0A9W7Y8V2_9FUNG|nr:hypothetical protein LPJ61_005585 [Coemansia biformis]
MRVLALTAAVMALGAMGLGATTPADAKASPASADQGQPQRIVCQINRDRTSRHLSPVFLHRTLSDAAQSLGQRYAAGTLSNGYFDQLVASKIAPLGNGVGSSYKILGTFASDWDYVNSLERSIFDQLFDRTLDAIGVSESSGVYTIVLATGLSQRPSTVETCPSGNTQFSPSGNGSGDNPSTTANGVDLTQFLCAFNSRRAHVNADAFVVHRALASEAEAQAEQMVMLGHYTVDGPRKVDESLYSQGVNVKQLYWIAGDTYRGASNLVELLDATYSNYVMNTTYSVIGVAQKNGFWSVILASLYHSVHAYKPCPLTLDDVDYTS